MFLDAVALGDFDAAFDGHEVHRDDLAGRLDFIGMNYYESATVQGLGNPPFPDQAPFITFDPFLLLLAGDASGPRAGRKMTSARESLDRRAIAQDTADRPYRLTCGHFSPGCGPGACVHLHRGRRDHRC